LITVIVTYKPTVDDLQKLAIFFERSIVEFFPKYEALTTVEEHVDALARTARKLPGEVVKQLYVYVEFLESVHGDRDDSEARRQKAKKARKMKLSGKRKAEGA
jgi:transcriptional regulator with XRE-family HTH domain